MKTIFKIVILLLLVLVAIPVFFLGYLGFIPGLSSLLGTDKPRDLGIKYAETDLSSCHTKSQIEYTTLAENNSPSQTRQFIGKKDVTAEFTAAEITATLNNQSWKYWPYKNLQVKFNADGSGEISGTLIKDKVSGYAAAIGIPGEAASFVMKYLPDDPVFYVKMKASLENNQVAAFEPETIQVGRLSLPLNVILSFEDKKLIKEVIAQDLGSMAQELSKVQNKRALIIGYINSRLSSAFGSFYAKKAYFGENKLYFEGTLSEKISYTP